MKTAVLGSVLLFSVLGIVLGAPQKKNERREKPTFRGVAEELFTHMIAPRTLLLSVTDEASLKKAIGKLQRSQLQIVRLTKDLQELPVPGDEEKRAVAKEVEKKMSGTAGDEKLSTHLDQMPKELKKNWEAATREFYAKLGKNRMVLETYFNEKEQKLPALKAKP